jgi:hypothetical protein
MKRTRSRRTSSRLGRQTVALAFAAPEVMAHRMARLALAGPTPSARDRREFHRMGAEKVAAFYESWNAMSLAMFRAFWSFALSPWQWGSPRARRAGSNVLAAGLAPLQRRATANARRLRRTRIV